MQFVGWKYANYALALLATGVALALSHLVAHVTGVDLPPYISLLPVVVIVALTIGLRPGILVTAMAALFSGYWILPPRGEFALTNRADAVGLVIFAGSSLFLCLLSETVRKKVDAYKVLNDNLLREIELRKQTEDFLANRERDLSRVQETAHLGSWKWHIGTDRVVWSRELYRIFGVDPETFVPSNTAANQLLHPDDRDRHGQLVALALSGKTVGPFECRICPPDGTERIVLASGFDLEVDSSGKPTVLIGTVLDITELKLAQRKISEYQQQLQSMVIELSMAQERERFRIAGELHDQVGQNLLLGKMKLNELMQQLPNDEPLAGAAAIESIIDQSIQDIRSLTFQMRPPLLVSGGLGPALHWLGEELQATLGLKVELDEDCSHMPLRYDARYTVFQAARELMLNVAKHAGTKACRVTLKRQDAFLMLTVEDHGVGLPPSPADIVGTMKSGFGLFNLQQRIEHLGGKFSLEDKVSGGVLATIKVPVEAMVD